MANTITIRADERLRQALGERAEALGTTVSALVRQILEDALAQQSWEHRVGHMRGRLQVREAAVDGWRKHLRDRNWRP